MTTPQPDHFYLVRITRARVDDDERFEEQRAAIAATGATFQQSKNWLLEFDQIGQQEIDTLNELFRLAKEYGTTVRILRLTE